MSGQQSLSPSDSSNDLASWVHQVRQRNSSVTPVASPSSTSFSPSTASVSELELEFQRQKQQRQERRDRLSVSGVRGISSQPTSPLPTPSLGHSSSLDQSFTTMLPSSDSANASLLGTSPTKASGVTGVRRANSFLARHGGESGPTGIAAGPKGATDSPVSLASFMGGKAAGPRLGKLTGDGKSAPPEVELIHENRGVALPGLANPAAQYGGRSLASFLGDRADNLGHQRPIKTTSTSPIKTSPSFTAPIRSTTTDDEPTRSASPAKYGFSQAELGRPVKTSADMQAPASPKKAYLDLVEKQQASAPTSPVIQRASSPSKYHRFGGESIPASPQLERPSSPTKQNSFLGSSNAVSRPLPVPGGQAVAHSSPSVSKKDAATSPIKPEAPAGSQPEVASGAALPKSVSQRLQTSDSLPSSRSNELLDSDRMPTPTLTRLNAQRMVGQRIKEAQLSDAAAQKELEAVQVGSGRSVPTSPAVRERWPPSSASSQNLLSPSKQPAEERRAAPWSPNKYGNALPGLASRSPIKEASASPWSVSSQQKEEAEEKPRAEPIRLPGLGGSVSPFQRSEAKSDLSSEQLASDESVLTPLTKSRARGPSRRGAPGKASEYASVAAIDPVAKHVDDAAPRTALAPASAASKPADQTTNAPRRTHGPRIHVLISGSGSNLQSLIDATLASPPPGIPSIGDGQISFVLSNRKAAYGLIRAAESNPPIPTKVLALKTWQNRNPGGTREHYDQVLARAVLDGPDESGKSAPPDLIVLAGFMHIVSEPFLHALGHQTSLAAYTPTLGQRPSKPVPIINLHPALPHAFDGANAIPRAMEAYKQGLVDKTGCMVHEVVADVDRGRPIIVREVPILPSYTLETLEGAIHKIEHVIIVQAADLVLKGYLQQLDKQVAESAQVPGRSASPKKTTRRDLKESVPIKGYKEVVASAALLVTANKAAWEQYVLASSSVPRQPPIKAEKNTVMEAISVNADGTTHLLTPPGGATRKDSNEVRPEQVVYDDETILILAKSSPSTQLWVRTGHASALHPFELGPKSTSCPEGRKIAELAGKHSVQPRFVPAGCEEPDLITAIGASWVVTRLGSRRTFDADAPALYRVRQAVNGTDTETCSINQVSSTAANVSSGDSFVFSGLSAVVVWHGKGSPSATRATAVQFANAIDRATRVVETSDGLSDELFWKSLQGSGRSASAWYHGAQAHVPKSTLCSLLDVDLRQGQLAVSPQSTKGYFGTDDLLLPTRNDKVSILNLEDRELFVVVGQDARSDKMRIAAAVHIAHQSAVFIQSRLRELVASETAIVARPAVHVLILPSKVPQEIRSAARIWSDEVVEYLQGPTPVQMNVLSGEQAFEQLQQDAWPLWQLQDPDFLPVGIASADVQHLV